MVEVALVVANCSWDGKRKYNTWLPAIPLLCSLLEDKFKFILIDANVDNLSEDELFERVRGCNPKIILISALSVDYQSNYHKVALISKKAVKDSTVLMGGVYPTLVEDSVLDENIDYIYRGQLKKDFVEVLNFILNGNYENVENSKFISYSKNGKVISNDSCEISYSYENLIKPSYKNINMDKYFNQTEYNPQNYSTECSNKRSVNILTSYGCKYNCVFCATRSINGKNVTYRDLDEVIQEIVFFVEEFKVQHISFMDDNIVADRSRAMQLFEAIERLDYGLELQIGNLAVWEVDKELLYKMKKAGCNRIGISIESGSQRVINEIIKKPINLETIHEKINMFNEIGIMVVADFIIGLPGESWNEIKETFRFAEKCDVDLCNFNIATPYPKTELYRILKEKNLIKNNFSFRDPKFYINGVISTDEYNIFDLKILQTYEWERINFLTKDKVYRVKSALRLTDDELEDYRINKRNNLIKFIKNYDI